MKVSKTRGGINLELLEGERDVLVQLIDDFREFVMSEDISDPAVARLFPDAYEGEEESAEFRKYSEPALRKRRMAIAPTFVPASKWLAPSASRRSK